MILADRLTERMEECRVNQSELARIVGISQSAIWKLTSGGGQGSKHLHKIASALNTTPEYLTGETDEPGLAGVSEGRRSFTVPSIAAAAPAGLVPVKEIDLSLGAGGTYLDDGAVMETIRYFPRDWLREFTDAPAEMLVFARVKGDSMKPTLSPGAIVMIDLRRKRIDEQEEVWAVAVADIGMVKRIYAQPDGSYKLKSDNPAVGPEIAVDDEMFVIGRVVASIGKH